MSKIVDFFHTISPKIIKSTNNTFGNIKEIKYKDKNNPLDIVTKGDFDNEKIIISEIKKWFPDHNIVAEETFSSTKNPEKGKTWIIDPICGTLKFKNGIRFFSTNVALANNGKLIASCVIDHCKQEYVWSTGNHEIYINKKKFNSNRKSNFTTIEVDLSSTTQAPLERIENILKLVSFLARSKKYYLSTFCTSLAYTYTSLGRIDGYINSFSHAWDTAAANFLILQAGGIVTEVDGKPWSLTSDNVLASYDKELHAELLNILNS